MNSFLKINTKLLLVFLVMAIVNLSCKKFLDEKPIKSLVLPATLEDYQLILENSVLLDAGHLAEVSSDDYYFLNSSLFLAEPVFGRNAATWQSDIFQDGTDGSSEWTTAYRAIYYANCVIEGLEKITDKSSTQYKFISGWAHFMRGSAYHRLATVFAPQYSSANSNYGLPLKLKASVTESIKRSSLHETYDLILNDLLLAADVLPNELQEAKNRPNKAAALGMLARVYLTMGKYAEGLNAATKSLENSGLLMDYNTLSTTVTLPFARTNVEILSYMRYATNVSVLSNTASTSARIPQELYDSYHQNDLRKVLYFQLRSGLPAKKGNYTGSIACFAGLATDEVYLMKAECLARAGAYQDAMAELNKLLVTRFVTGTYVPLTASSKEDALAKILVERRKELVMRGLRWLDLRRLNAEGANIVPTRIVNGQTYSIAPNSPLYTLPIPPDEIRLSGIFQNPR